MTSHDHSCFVITANKLAIPLANVIRFMDMPIKVQEEAREDIVFPIIEELIAPGLKMNGRSLWLNLKHKCQPYLDSAQNRANNCSNFYQTLLAAILQTNVNKKVPMLI